MRKSTGSSLSFGCLLVAALMITGATAVSLATPVPQRSTDPDRHEIREFDEFLSHHPWIANKLWEKPSRAKDKDFLEDNKELRYWLQDHQLVREELREDARAFMDSVREFERYGRNDDERRSDRDDDTTRAEFARFNRFLDTHPRIAQDLNRNPSLVNNADYLEDHRELREFLRNHPAMREQLNENPRAFM